MTTYPLPTLAAQITPQGIVAPSFADVLASLQASYRLIYGPDVNLDPSTQDGEWIGVIAQAVSDCNAATIAAYNSFSPVNAQGNQLSSLVKINGLRRIAATNSTVDVVISGDVGTIINNGVVGDQDGQFQWALPVHVEIPTGGSITVTATCVTSGAITADPATITKIVNPTLGWRSVTNVDQAAVGEAGETDAALRERQSVSTSLPAQTVLEAIVGAVANLSGVSRLRAYENDQEIADSNSLPAHSISLVVEGGDAQTIANTIASKKTPGTATYGTTSELVIDQLGVPATINFFRPTAQRIVVGLTLKALTGYVSTTTGAIQAALAAYVNGLEIGQEVDINGLVAAATLPGLISTYKIVVDGMKAAVFPAAPVETDVVITFNEAATLQASDVSVTVT